MSGVGSCAAGGLTESPTAMMRMAKIADEVGATGVGADATLASRSRGPGDESLRRRGPGGSLRGRGGTAIGRGAFETALVTPESSGPSAGSEGVRVPASLSAIDGFERRLGIGGG